MRVDVSYLFVSTLLGTCVLQPSQAQSVDFFFDLQNPEINLDQENYSTGSSEKRLSWRLGVDPGFSSKPFKGEADFTYREDSKDGRGRYETRMSWKLLNLTLTGKYSNSWFNQTRNLRQPVVRDNWYVIESSYDFSSRPYSGFSFSYGKGSRQQNDIANELPSYEEALTDMQAKFRFRHELLAFSVAAGQFRIQDDEKGVEAVKENRLFIRGNFFPEYSVSLQPSFLLNYKTDTIAGFNRDFEQMETALGLVYQPVESAYRFSIKTAYENQVLAATNEDRDILKFAAKIDWKSETRKRGSSSDWSIDYQLKDIRDNINPNARTSDWSISLIWRMPIG